MPSFFLNPSPERVGVICMTALVVCVVIVIMIGSLFDCLKTRKAAQERINTTDEQDDLEKSNRAGEQELHTHSWNSTSRGDCLGQPAIYSPWQSKFKTPTQQSALPRPQAKQPSTSAPSSAPRTTSPSILPSHVKMSPLLQAHLRQTSGPTTSFPVSETHQVYIQGRSTNMPAIPITKLLPLLPRPSSRTSRSPAVAQEQIRHDHCTTNRNVIEAPGHTSSSPPSAHVKELARSPVMKPLPLLPTPLPSAMPDPRVLLQVQPHYRSSGKATPPLPLTPWHRNMLPTPPDTASTADIPTLTFSSSPPQAGTSLPGRLVSSSATPADLNLSTSSRTTSGRPFKIRSRQQIVASQQSMRRHMPDTPTPLVEARLQPKRRLPPRQEANPNDMSVTIEPSETAAPLPSTVKLLHDLSSGRYAAVYGNQQEAQSKEPAKPIYFLPMQSPTYPTTFTPTKVLTSSPPQHSMLDSPTLPPPRPLPPVPSPSTSASTPASSLPDPALVSRVAQAQAWGRGAGRDDDNGRYGVPRKPLPLRKDTGLVPTTASLAAAPSARPQHQPALSRVGGNSEIRKDSAASDTSVAITVLEDWDGVENDITPDDEEKGIDLHEGERSPIAGLRYPKVPRECAMVWSRQKCVGWD
jgi:hypothetical protein